MVTRGLGWRGGMVRESGIDMYILLHLKWVMELLWWSSGWESTLQCGGHGFHPWSGNRDPTCWVATESVCHNYRVCASQLQSLWATTSGSMRHYYWVCGSQLQSPCTTQSPVPQQKILHDTRRILCATTKTWHSHINTLKNVLNRQPTVTYHTAQETLLSII